MQRREFWERQFTILQELTVNHLTGFYCSIFTFFTVKITVIFYSDIRTIFGSTKNHSVKGSLKNHLFLTFL